MANYAIVQTGGKQYRVHPGDTIRVESVSEEEGTTVELDDVRMLSTDGEVTLGTPSIPGVKVMAEVVSNGRGKKVIVFKYKPKTRYRKKNGHRQAYTAIKVTDILLNEDRSISDGA